MAKRISSNSVVAFLAALATALKSLAREAPSPESRDPFLRVEAEVQQFFLNYREHENLTDEEWRDLQQMQEVLRYLYHAAALVMLDPSKETPH